MKGGGISKTLYMQTNGGHTGVTIHDLDQIRQTNLCAIACRQQIGNRQATLLHGHIDQDVG